MQSQLFSGCDSPGPHYIWDDGRKGGWGPIIVSSIGPQILLSVSLRRSQPCLGSFCLQQAVNVNTRHCVFHRQSRDHCWYAARLKTVEHYRELTGVDRQARWHSELVSTEDEDEVSAAAVTTTTSTMTVPTVVVIAHTSQAHDTSRCLSWLASWLKNCQRWVSGHGLAGATVTTNRAVTAYRSMTDQRSLSISRDTIDTDTPQPSDINLLVCRVSRRLVTAARLTQRATKSPAARACSASQQHAPDLTDVFSTASLEWITSLQWKKTTSSLFPLLNKMSAP